MLSIFETRFVCYLKQGTHSLYYKDLLFRDIVALYSANYSRHINTFCEQSITFLNVKAPLSCSFALKGTMTSDVLTVLIMVDKNRRFGEQLSRHCEPKFSGLKQYKNFRLTLLQIGLFPFGVYTHRHGGSPAAWSISGTPVFVMPSATSAIQIDSPLYPRRFLRLCEISSLGTKYIFSSFLASSSRSLRAQSRVCFYSPFSRRGQII